MAKSDMTVTIDVKGVEEVERIAARVKELERQCEMLEQYMSGASEQFVDMLAEKVAYRMQRQLYLRTGKVIVDSTEGNA